MNTLAQRPGDRFATPPLRRSAKPHWVTLSVASVLVAIVAAVSLAEVAANLDVDDPLSAFVSATNSGDTAGLAELLVGEGREAWIARSEWLASTDAILSLSDCTTAGGLITCELHFGHDWFYNRAAPPDVARQGSLMTSLEVEVREEGLRLVEWEMPPAVETIEESFRAWALRAHPSMARAMWEDASRGGALRIDEASGRAHAGLLSEYLAQRSRPVD